MAAGSAEGAMMAKRLCLPEFERIRTPPLAVPVKRGLFRKRTRGHPKGCICGVASGAGNPC